MSVHNAAITAPRAPTRPKTARRADAEERPHPETEIERAGMNEQSFEHVLMPAHVRAPQPTRLAEMGTRSLEQFAASAASAEEPFSAVAADAPAIRLDRVPVGVLIRPRLAAAIRFADVGANLHVSRSCTIVRL